jgi:hypothetical protein
VAEDGSQIPGDTLMLQSSGGKEKNSFRIVAQIFNLLYRGFEIRQVWQIKATLYFPRLAECNSAIQQIENLRYGLNQALSECRSNYPLFPAG